MSYRSNTIKFPDGKSCNISVNCDGNDHSYGKFIIDDERFPGVTLTNDYMRWSKLSDI